MKKIFALVLALTALVSCSEANGEPAPENAPEPALSEPLEKEDAPHEYLELSADDFTQIDVNMTIQENAPPLNIDKYKLDIKSGEARMSACKSVLYPRDAEKEADELASELPEGWNEEERTHVRERSIKSIEAINRIAAKPSTAYVAAYSLCGEHFLYMLNYDNVCSGSHCFEIYDCNVTTGEHTLIYSYNDASRKYSIYSLKKVGEDVYISGGYSESDEGVHKNMLCRIDRENNELVDILPEELRDNYSVYLDPSADGVVLTEWEYVDFEAEGAPGKTRYMMYRYENGEWEKVIECMADNDFVYPLAHGGLVMTGEYVDRELVCDVEGRYHLNTGIRSAKILAFTDNRVCVTTEDKANNKTLYVFDLLKKERYRYDLKGYGHDFSGYFIGENLVIRCGMGYPAIFLIPELGAGFQCFENTDIRGSSENAWYVMNIPYFHSYDAYIDEEGVLVAEENSIMQDLSEYDMSVTIISEQH